MTSSYSDFISSLCRFVPTLHAARAATLKAMISARIRAVNRNEGQESFSTAHVHQTIVAESICLCAILKVAFGKLSLGECASRMYLIVQMLFLFYAEQSVSTVPAVIIHRSLHSTLGKLTVTYTAVRVMSMSEQHSG